MSQEFSSTGIQDGQIVEASEVSQSVDAFTGAKAYDITISGSLTVSGSVNDPTSTNPPIKFTGSLINDGPGQFSHMGIGVAADNDQFALYIVSDAAGGFDPVMKIEGNTGNDIPQLAFQNEDINWTIRIGQPNKDFEILQSGSTNIYPFIISKDQLDGQLYLTENASIAGKPGNVGIGLGFNAVSDVNGMKLDNGPGYSSLKVAQIVSGSLLKSTTISASAAGENIHGTASYATFIETAQTASYAASKNPLNAGSIDFFYNIAGGNPSPNNNSQINAEHLNAKTGSTGMLTLDSNNVTTMDNFGEGLYIGNPTDNYYVLISGSCDTYSGPNESYGIAWIGNPYSQNGSKPPFIQIEQESTSSKGYIKLGDQIGGSSQVIFSRDPNAGFDSEDLTVNDDLTVSGSGANKVEMDGFDPGTFVLFASSSLVPNDLKFDVKNNGSTVDSVARIANMNTSVASQLSFQIGSAPHSSNSILEISSSDDVQIPEGNLNYGLLEFPNPGTFPARELHAYESLGRDVNCGNGIELGGAGYQRSVRCKPITTSSGGTVNLIEFVGEDLQKLLNPTTLGNGTYSQMYTMDVSCLGRPTNNSTGVFLKARMVVRWDSSTNIWQIINQGSTEKMIGFGSNFLLSNIALTGYGDTILDIVLVPYSSTTTKWASWIDIKTPGPFFNAP